MPRHPKLKFTWPYLPALCWWLLTLYLFTLPGSAIPKVSWLDKYQADKWVHAFLFLVLVWLMYLPARPSRHSLWAVVPLAIAYGIAIEFVQQYWVVHRSFDIDDIAADALGCLLVPLLLRTGLLR
jgi:VanZ family protein